MKKSLIMLFLFFLVCSAFTLGQNESPSTKDTEIEITGVVRLVGNEPFTDLVVTTDSGEDYVVDEAEREKMAPFINHRISLKAIMKTKTLEIADGSQKFEKYFIHSIEILTTN